jgi:glycopeptide antibiotics resistance protein
MLVPFWSYRAIAKGGGGIFPEVFWNLVLFIPIGILFMLFLTCKRKCVITVIIGFLLTTVIELIQLIFHRGYFEFDDIFHNTLGTVIGIGIYLIFVKLLSGFGVFKKVKE